MNTRSAGGRVSTLECTRSIASLPCKLHSAGFTLIELVATVVIVGAIVAVAVPIFRDLRFEARRAALETIRATMVANMQLARAAYLAQGPGPGSTVQINGQTIEVFGEDAVDGGNNRVPPGAPTAAGMFRMLGCGTSAPPPETETRCDGLPGYLVWIRFSYLAVWPASTTTTFMDTACYVGYWPPAGYDDLWPPDALDPLSRLPPWWGMQYASDWAYYPRSENASGC